MKINFSAISIFLLCFIFFMTSCEKEVVDSILDSDENNQDGIKMGVHASDIWGSSFIIVVNVKDGESGIKHQTLDIDHDGIMDVGFELNSQYSFSYGQISETFIYTINPNASIKAYLTTDTTFQEKDTTANKIVNTVSCSRLSPNSLVLGTKTNQKRIRPVGKGAFMGQNGFLSGKIKLYKSSYRSPETNNSPPYTYSTYYNNDCSMIYASSTFYLGIKILKDNEVKLGWVKYNQSSGNMISIHEIAIQH